MSELLHCLNDKLKTLSSGSVGGLQPIPGDPKDNGVTAMLDDRTFCFVIQHSHHAIVFLDLQGLVANHLHSQWKALGNRN